MKTGPVKRKLASGQKRIDQGARAFVRATLTAGCIRENRFAYDGLASAQSVYTYVRSNPLRWTDPEGLFDPGATTTVNTAIATTTGIATSTIVAGIAGIAAMAYPSPVGTGSDQPPKQCEDDSKCQELYKRIDIAVNGIQRRYRQIRENMGNIDPTTHQDQLEQRQVNLRKLLLEANTKGCLNYRSDAWDWASTPTPQPGPR